MQSALDMLMSMRYTNRFIIIIIIIIILIIIITAEIIASPHSPWHNILICSLCGRNKYSRLQRLPHRGFTIIVTIPARTTPSSRPEFLLIRYGQYLCIYIRHCVRALTATLRQTVSLKIIERCEKADDSKILYNRPSLL